MLQQGEEAGQAMYDNQVISSPHHTPPSLKLYTYHSYEHYVCREFLGWDGWDVTYDVCGFIVGC